jgi:hypothetical protein
LIHKEEFIVFKRQPQVVLPLQSFHGLDPIVNYRCIIEIDIGYRDRFEAASRRAWRVESYKMFNDRKRSSLGRRPFASIHSRGFFVEVLELCAHLLTFDEEEREYPLTVTFTGCHKDTY